MDIWLVILSVMPSLLIAAFLYIKDKSREPGAWLILAFFAGMASIMPAWLLEQLWHNYVPFDEDSVAETLMLAFIGIALMEELPKFLFLRIGFYPRTFFDEPLDGIIYAGMVGMGFAMVENLLYAVEHGIGTTILRAFTAVPAHAVFAAFMGYYMGLAKFDTNRRPLLMRKSLLWAILIHGFYDFFLIQNFIPGLIGLAILVLYVSIYFSMRLIRMHQAIASRYIPPAAILSEITLPEAPPASQGIYDTFTDDIIRDMQQNESSNPVNPVP